MNEPELLAGKTDLDIWPKELADKYIADDAEVLKSGKPLVVEETILDKGEIKWFETFKSPVFDSQGIAIGTTGYSHDITERKQAEEALLQSERKLSSVLENMSEGLMLFDANGTIVYQNPASLNIHGVQFSDSGPIEYLSLPVLWKYWDEKGHLLNFDEWPISRVIRGERVQNQVLRAQRDDTGHEFFASYNGNLISDENGDIAFGFITIHDITKQKRVEEKARQLHEVVVQEKDRLSALVSSITDEIWFADSKGEFTLVNPSGSKEFGLDTAERIDVKKFASSLEVLQPDGSPRPIEEAPALRALRGETVRYQEEFIRNRQLNPIFPRTSFSVILRPT